MKRARWIVLTLIVCTMIARSEGGDRDTDQSESQVRKAEEELTSALLRGDVSALGRIYADDYAHIGTDGVLSHKSDRISEFETGLRKITYLRREDVQVSIYGTVALVRDVDTVQGSFRGKDTGGRARATRIWLKQQQGWRLVAAQVTALSPRNECYFSLAYSALAEMRMGMSGSASFQRARKS
jgi:ketosteroid isomerase-like protein